jgi:hypothetical protein
MSDDVGAGQQGMGQHPQSGLNNGTIDCTIPATRQGSLIDATTLGSLTGHDLPLPKRKRHCGYVTQTVAMSGVFEVSVC